MENSSNQKINDFVRLCITEAFLKLLSEKPFDKITIAELTEKAGVARVSFYRNFSNKEEVLAKYIEKIFLEMEYTPETARDKEIIRARLLASYRLSLENKDFFLVLKKNGLLYLIYDALKQITPEHIKETGFRTNRLHAPFMVGAIYGILEDWIEHDMKYPVEKLVDELVEILFQLYEGETN